MEKLLRKEKNKWPGFVPIKKPNFWFVIKPQSFFTDTFIGVYYIASDGNKMYLGMDDIFTALN